MATILYFWKDVCIVVSLPILPSLVDARILEKKTDPL